MITLNESNFIKELSKVTKKKTYFHKYKFIHLFNKVFISFVVLGLSAYFSYNFHFEFWSGNAIPKPELFAIFSTSLISIILAFLADEIRKNFLEKESISEVLIIALLSVLSLNIYTDLQGVEQISINNIEKPSDTKTSEADQLYKSQLKELENQERAILQKYVLRKDKLKSIEYLRTAYIPKNGNKYHSKESVKNDLKELSKIRAARTELTTNHAQQRTVLINEHSSNLKQYDKKLSDTILKFKFGAGACALIYILSVLFRVNFEYRVIKENSTKPETKEQTTQENATETTLNTPETIKKETIKDSETIKAIKSSVQSSDTLDDKVLKCILEGWDRKQIVSAKICSKGQITKSLKKQFFKYCKNLHDENEVNELLNRFDLHSRDFIDEYLAATQNQESVKLKKVV